jgi:hypothetical protein
MDPAVAAALVTSLFALLTSAWTIREMTRHQRLELRREVYLNACEWTASGAELLFALSSPGFDSAQLQKITQPYASAYFKVQLVGSQRTVETFSDASAYLANQVVVLIRAREALRQAQARGADPTETRELKTNLREGCENAIKEYGEKLVRAGLAMHEELRIPLNEKAYRKSLKDSQNALAEALASLQPDPEEAATTARG